MRAFTCGNCGRLAPFESKVCLHCDAQHGFDWAERDSRGLLATRTRPADDDPTGLERFAVAEAAKRRLVFELGELGLPCTAG